MPIDEVSPLAPLGGMWIARPEALRLLLGRLDLRRLRRHRSVSRCRSCAHTRSAPSRMSPVSAATTAGRSSMQSTRPSAIPPSNTSSTSCHRPRRATRSSRSSSCTAPGGRVTGDGRAVAHVPPPEPPSHVARDRPALHDGRRAIGSGRTLRGSGTGVMVGCAISVGGRRFVVYVVWDRRGEVEDYVPYALAGLRPHAERILVVVNGSLSDAGGSSEPVSDEVLVRDAISVSRHLGDIRIHLGAGSRSSTRSSSPMTPGSVRCVRSVLSSSGWSGPAVRLLGDDRPCPGGAESVHEDGCAPLSPPVVLDRRASRRCSYPRRGRRTGAIFRRCPAISMRSSA